MIIIIGHVITSPETAAETTRLCREHSARSRAEPGCLAHNVHADCEDPARLVFVERWADMDALRAHFALTESRAGDTGSVACSDGNENLHGRRVIARPLAARSKIAQDRSPGQEAHDGRHTGDGGLGFRARA